MSRRSFWWIATAFTLLAVGFTIVSLIVVSEVQRLDATKRTLAMTQRQLASVTVHNAGSICLFAKAPTKRHERQLIHAYLSNDWPITRLFTPECADVARRAAHDIFNGRGLPPTLERELGPKPKEKTG